MTDERDETLDELRAAMNIKPSPEFEARVRLATRESRPRGAAWSEHRRRWIWGAVAGGSVAAAVMAVVLLRSGDTGAPSSVAIAQPQPIAASGTLPRSTQQTAAVATRLEPKPTIATRRAARPASADRVTRREPEVLVPPDQAIALAHLLQGVSDGRVMIGAIRATEEDVTIAPLPEPAPVTVKDVRIEPLPVPAGGAS
jgi:hypothetical protein